MAVSGSKNFALTRADIISAALRKIGAADSGETPDAGEGADASMALNLVVKELSARGLDLPWRETVTLFLQPDTQSYRIGLTGDHATTAYIETTLATAEALGSNSLGLTATTGMTVADHIGVKLDDGTIHWTTITNVSGTTIAVGLASAAAAGNKVYTYTIKAYRPQRIVYAHRRDASGIDIPVDLIGDVAYRGLSLKSAAGPVNQAFYQPTLDNGTLFVWPANKGGPDKLILIAQNLADDFDAAGDNPQFPIEWGNPLIYLTADALAPEYGISLRERQLLKAEAAEKLETLLNYDVENASVIIGLEIRPG
jgi:hypothetical protein